jgi:hypothetical protein
MINGNIFFAISANATRQMAEFVPFYGIKIAFSLMGWDIVMSA